MGEGRINRQKGRKGGKRKKGRKGGRKRTVATILGEEGGIRDTRVNNG
jgi:hypothetical protein